MINIHLIFILKEILIMLQLDRDIYYTGSLNDKFHKHLMGNKFTKAVDTFITYGLSLHQIEDSEVSNLAYNKHPKLLKNTYLFFLF